MSIVVNVYEHKRRGPVVWAKTENQMLIKAKSANRDRYQDRKTENPIVPLHNDSSNLSLFNAAHKDTKDSVLLKVELKSIEQGTSKGGTYPSYNDLYPRPTGQDNYSTIQRCNVVIYSISGLPLT